MKYLMIISALFLSGCYYESNENILELTTVDNMGGCTGFVIEHQGHQRVLTNRHCFDGGVFYTKKDKVRLEPLDCAPFSDVCMLDGEALPSTKPLKIATSHPHFGDKVTICGYGRMIAFTCTEGVFVASIREPVLDVYYPDYYTATILPGNSGSPILNADGEVIGIAYASGDIIAYRALGVSLYDLQKFLND